MKTTARSRARSISATLGLGACALMAGCGQKILGKNCKSTGNSAGLVGKDSGRADKDKHSFSLETHLQQPASKEIVGGFLKFSAYDLDDLIKHDIGTKPANKESRCSAVFEVRQSAGKYVARVFTHQLCVKEFYYDGTKPVLEIFSENPQGAGTYETVAINLPIEAERDAMLQDVKALGLTGIEATRVREAFMNRFVQVERAGSVRGGIAAKDRTLFGQMCATVPPTSPEDPVPNNNYDYAIPGNCVWQSQFQVIDVTLAPETVSAHQALLDGLAARTKARDEALAANTFLAKGTLDKLRARDEKVKALEAAEYKHRRLKLVEYVVTAVKKGETFRPNTAFDRQDVCLDLVTPTKAERWCIPDTALKAKLATLIVKHAAPSHEALVKNIVERNYPQTELSVLQTHLSSAEKAVLAARAALAETLLELHPLIEAEKSRLALATNHLTNPKATPGGIAFRSVPLFAATPDAILKNMNFRFDASRLLFDADTSKENMNLQLPLHRGSIITLEGYPLLSMIPDSDQSGGASVLPLPQRASRPDSADGSGPSATNGKDDGRQSADGC